MAYRLEEQRRPSAVHILVAAAALLFFIFYVLPSQYESTNSVPSRATAHRLAHVGGSNKQQQQQLQQQQSLRRHADGPVGKAAAALPSSNWTKYFFQAQRCQGPWLRDYANLHAAILEGNSGPRYLVSVPPHSGLADRLVGFVTHFWHAVLTDRAWTTVSHPENPGLDAICEAPTFDWTRAPQAVTADAVMDRLRKGFKGPGKRSQVPAGFDQAKYSLQYLFDSANPTRRMYGRLDLCNNSKTYLAMVMNRGRTYRLASNPHHKRQLEQIGVPARDLFMCGFFAMCQPVPAVQQYYQKYWDALSEPGILRIGIQVRLGDQAMWANGPAPDPRKVLAQKWKFFKCAERLEAAFAAPGQKVVWFLNSDSQQLRQAAKAKYGSKLLTDDELVMVHPECERRPPANNTTSSSGSGSSTSGSAGCEAASRAWALQHSLGSVLTFSMTDYQIITIRSGFGRTGAWLADRRDGIYEINGLGDCVPGKPTPLNVSSDRWSGI